MEADQQVDIWRETLQKDLEAIKTEQVNMKSDIRRLQDKELMQDQQIDSIKEDLKEIKEDTKWLRHAITNALIVALIGGAVAIFFAAIQNFN
ncbi:MULTISPECIES: hemolysin XhlA family protein [Heyndrickxia]|uniref:Hemolysin XhlA family protein n=1 Tax=Heyndrickxia faecalis TaxID=2824910 RepID=A0AAU7WCM5_9BACI|nr:MULTISPECIES: hemolysin XhlA family protein [Heyndrickxia]MED4922133.1 hemolysin XhlA family protein [Weizmannia sp. CD-2023]